MTRVLWSLVGLLLALSPTVPASAAPGTSQTAVLEHLTEVGSAIRLGFGVSPLHGPPAPAPADIPGLHEAEQSTVVSVDLNLAWPGTGRTSVLEPYVTLGPALFVVEPDAGRLLSTRADPTLQVGARAGAGINWRLGKHTTLFGGYQFTTPAPDGLVPSVGRPSAERGIAGHDFTYGLRFVY